MMPRGNIHSRLENLERRTPRPQQRAEVRPELREFLDRYAERKATGTLTAEDKATADDLKAEVKNRRAAGEIG